MFRTLLTFVVVGSLLAGSSTFAQRDAGAKARREIGKGFWSPSQERSNARVPQRLTRTYSTPSYRPVENQPVESSRSFSYEPSLDEPVLQAEDSDAPREPASPKDGEEGESEQEESEYQNGSNPSPCQQAPAVSYRRFSYEPAAAVMSDSAIRGRNSAQARPTPPKVRLRPGSGR